jgi:hypothetical protein
MYLKSIYSLEVFDICRHQHAVMLKGTRRNLHIGFAYDYPA